MRRTTEEIIMKNLSLTNMRMITLLLGVGLGLITFGARRAEASAATGVAPQSGAVTCNLSCQVPNGGTMTMIEWSGGINGFTGEAFPGNSPRTFSFRLGYTSYIGPVRIDFGGRKFYRFDIGAGGNENLIWCYSYTGVAHPSFTDAFPPAGYMSIELEVDDFEHRNLRSISYLANSGDGYENRVYYTSPLSGITLPQSPSLPDQTMLDPAKWGNITYLLHWPYGEGTTITGLPTTAKGVFSTSVCSGIGAACDFSCQQPGAGTMTKIEWAGTITGITGNQTFQTSSPATFILRLGYIAAGKVPFQISDGTGNFYRFTLHPSSTEHLKWCYNYAGISTTFTDSFSAAAVVAVDLYVNDFVSRTLQRIVYTALSQAPITTQRIVYSSPTVTINLPSTPNLPAQADLSPAKWGNTTYELAWPVTGNTILGIPNISNGVFSTSVCPAVTLTLTPTEQAFAANGGTGTITISAPVDLAWIATNNAANFVTLTSPASGLGNSTLNFTVAANSSPTSRAGAITLNDQTFTVRQGAQFNDVPVGASFYTEIGKLSARGITQGCGAGRFCPETKVTREQMAVLIIRALHAPGYVPPAPTTQRFADVPLTHPFAAYIEELAARQITLGCGSGNYCPATNVTREQMAAFTIRALHAPGYTPPTPTSQRFADVPSANPFYAFIDEMAVRGITSGCGGGNYCPSQPITRAQMAAFLVRAFDL
jgi:hypothetical protein